MTAIATNGSNKRFLDHADALRWLLDQAGISRNVDVVIELPDAAKGARLWRVIAKLDAQGNNKLTPVGRIEWEEKEQ